MVPSIIEVLLYNGIGDKLTGTKNLPIIVGIVGISFINGIIPNTLPEGLPPVNTILLIMKNIADTINQTTKYGNNFL
jgi:hypothetical protein